MVYADYAFYTDTYLGTAIGIDEWPALALRASAYLDRLTFGRLKEGAAITDDVRMAACAVAEVVQRHQTALAVRADGVKSENTDGYSVTWEDSAAGPAHYDAEQLAAADLYLLRSDPLRYAGVD